MGKRSRLVIAGLLTAGMLVPSAAAGATSVLNRSELSCDSSRGFVFSSAPHITSTMWGEAYGPVFRIWDVQGGWGAWDYTSAGSFAAYQDSNVNPYNYRWTTSGWQPFKLVGSIGRNLEIGQYAVAWWWVEDLSTRQGYWTAAVTANGSSECPS